MNDIGEAEKAADQAAIPEGDGNHAVAFLLALQPLDQHAHAEDRLAAEPDQVPDHVIRMRQRSGQQVRHEAHYSSSVPGVPPCRRISQRTPRRSFTLTRRRPKLVYLERPAIRG